MSLKLGAIPVCLALLACVGCDGAKRTLTPPSREQMVAMACDMDDVDRSRQGIVMMSRQDWGRREPSLKLYSTLLRNYGHWQVEQAAVAALAAGGDAAYADDLLWALDRPSPAVRIEAAKALDVVHAPQAAQQLIKRAGADESSDVRCHAAWALRHYPQPAVVDALRRAMLDAELGVRVRARQALTQIAGRDMGPRAQDWLEFKLPAATAPGQSGEGQ